MVLIKALEVTGTTIGIIWFFLWLFRGGSGVLLFRGMDSKRLLYLGRNVGTNYFQNLLGNFARGILAGEVPSFAAASTGRIAARYGTTAVGVNVVSHGMGISYLNANFIIVLLFVFFFAAELLWEYKKDKYFFRNFLRFGTYLLESFVIFAVMQLVTDIVFT